VTDYGGKKAAATEAKKEEMVAETSKTESVSDSGSSGPIHKSEAWRKERRRPEGRLFYVYDCARPFSADRRRRRSRWTKNCSTVSW
jgi:hypothetical protein